MSQPIRSGLASLMNSVLQSLGAGDSAASIVLPRCKQVVLCLVDGLGAQLLDRYAHRAPYLSSQANRGRGKYCVRASRQRRLPAWLRWQLQKTAAVMA